MSTESGFPGDAMQGNLTRLERREALQKQIEELTRRENYWVDSRSDYEAVLVKGRRVNHLLHGIVSVLTVGVWLPVWILLTVFGGEKRRRFYVTPEGRVEEREGK
ncbi:MAG: hypothetical protein OXG11_04575 [Chloroflexi bacterium]|nr:hypothetical protein [Chloroflexota bacterium]